MRELRITYLAALMLTVYFFPAAAPALAADVVTFGDPVRQGGGTAVDPGDVYGEADFSLDAGNGGSISSALTGLMQSIVSQRYGNNEGNYLLTIELQRGGKTLVTRPLVTLSFTNKQFLFINVSSEKTSAAALGGVLWKEDSIDSGNNDVEISVKSYYKAKSSFDLSLFDALNDVSSNFGIAAKLDSVGITTSVLGSVQKVLQQALQDADTTSQLFSMGMSFAQLSQVDPLRVRQVEVPVSYSYHSGGKTAVGTLSLKIKTWSQSSRFLFDANTGKFISPRASVILGNAKVWTNEPAVSVVDFLQKSGSDDIRSFLTDVKGEGYKGNDVYGRCSALLAAYHQYLSNRDALALLWATVSEYRVGFRKSHALDCVQGRQQEFEGLGLPTAELISFLSS